MDNLNPHKAHRPTHSGIKAEKKSKAQGKEKQHGLNEKVYITWNGKLSFNHAFRPLLRNLVDGQTVRLGETLSATKLVYMSPS